MPVSGWECNYVLHTYTQPCVNINEKGAVMEITREREYILKMSSKELNLIKDGLNALIELVDSDADIVDTMIEQMQNALSEWSF